MNAIWIGVDLDNNTADVITDAHPIFQIAENSFCAYFTFEVIVRFGAFRRKRYCLRDWWFLFDVCLVTLMVGETWVLVAVMKIMGMQSASDLGPMSILRVARMAKMARMARMVRLVRAFPELIVLIKGIQTAIRSVVVFVLLWIIIIYIYAVIFKQVSANTMVGDIWFHDIPRAMNVLLLRAVFPWFADLLDDLADDPEGPWLWPILVTFIMLSSL